MDSLTLSHERTGMSEFPEFKIGTNKRMRHHTLKYNNKSPLPWLDTESGQSQKLGKATKESLSVR